MLIKNDHVWRILYTRYADFISTYITTPECPLSGLEVTPIPAPADFGPLRVRRRTIQLASAKMPSYSTCNTVKHPKNNGPELWNVVSQNLISELSVNGLSYPQYFWPFDRAYVHPSVNPRQFHATADESFYIFEAVRLTFIGSFLYGRQSMLCTCFATAGNFLTRTWVASPPSSSTRLGWKLSSPATPRKWNWQSGWNFT